MRSNDAAARRRELDDTAIKRSDVIKVTCREQAVPDAGRSIRSGSGRISQLERVGELGQLLNNFIPGRTSANQITLFKNNAGQGVADFAVASKIYSLARCHGIGMEF
jgi:alanine dehydrogenase